MEEKEDFEREIDILELGKALESLKNGPRGPEVLWIYVYIYIGIILINTQQGDRALS